MKRKGITGKLLLLLIVLIALIGGSIAISCRSMIKDLYMERENQKLEELVRMVASNIDGDKVIEYYETRQTDDYYFILRDYMDSVTCQVDDIGFLFVLVPEEDQFVYIIDSPGPRFTEEDRSSLGDTYEYRDTERDYLLPLFEQGKPSEEMIVGEIDEEYNVNPITAYAPVKNSNGETVAMVEGDMTVIHIRENMTKPISAILIVLLIGLLVLLVIVLFAVNKVIASPLEKLTQYISSYKDGKFEGERLEYKGDDEIKWLQDSFEDMDRKMNDYIEALTTMTAENERIGTELNVATKIQADLLPKIVPEFPNKKELEIFATMTPAKEVGGDFYDFFLIGDNKFGMVMADVSGKGVPAALFMVIAKTLIKNQAANTKSPSEILEIVNNQLCENNASEMFVTCWLGILDIPTGHVDAVNAGHEYPSIMRANGDFELLQDKHGVVLAAMEDMGYKEYGFDLNPGDRLFVYTDGVPEATDAHEELFGTDRMLVALNKHKSENPEQLLISVKEEIDTFVGEAPQFDDITMLTLTYNGPQAN